MDLNYLYQRQQVSRVNADRAACDNSRSAHRRMAEAYGLLIDQAKNGRVLEVAS